MPYRIRIFFMVPWRGFACQSRFNELNGHLFPLTKVQTERIVKKLLKFLLKPSKESVLGCWMGHKNWVRIHRSRPGSKKASKTVNSNNAGSGFDLDPWNWGNKCKWLWIRSHKSGFVNFNANPVSCRIRGYTTDPLSSFLQPQVLFCEKRDLLGAVRIMFREWSFCWFTSFFA